MTREETIGILMVIQAAYQNYRVPDKTVAVNMWHRALGEYSYEEVSNALDTFIRSDTKGFAPSPGQVIDKIHIVGRLEELNEMEAWSLVSKALRRGNYYAEEEYGKLPPEIRKAVGSPDNLRNWARAPEHDVETVIQSNFMRTYRTGLDRKRQYERLPVNVKALVSDTMKTQLLGGGS